jgi:hypothetical protein
VPPAEHFGHKAKPVTYDDDRPECQICGVPTVGDRHVGEAGTPSLPPIDVPIAPNIVTEMGVRAVLRDLPKSGTLRAEVVNAIRKRPSTDDELEVTLGRMHQSVSATTNRLRADGWLEAVRVGDVPVLRKTRSGNDAQVWTLTEEATRRLREAPGRGTLARH